MHVCYCEGSCLHVLTPAEVSSCVRQAQYMGQAHNTRYGASKVSQHQCLTQSWLLQEYQFKGIQKSEWNNLFSFIQAKRLRIENVAEAEMGPSGAVRPAINFDLGDDIDTGKLSDKADCFCQRC